MLQPKPLIVLTVIAVLAAAFYFLTGSTGRDEAAIPDALSAESASGIATIDSQSADSAVKTSVRGVVSSLDGPISGAEIFYRLAMDSASEPCELLRATSNDPVTHSGVRGEFVVAVSAPRVPTAATLCLALSIAKAGYITTSTRIASTEFGDALDIELDKQHSLHGVVTDPYGALVTDAVVNAWIAEDGNTSPCKRVDNASLSMARASVRGEFMIEVAGDNRYCIQASHTQWASSAPVVMEATHTDALTLALLPSIRVAGQVLDTHKAALANLALVLSRQGTPGQTLSYRAITDIEGKFTFGGVDAGLYALTTDNKEYALTHAQHLKISESIENLPITGYALTRITGRIVTVGAPLAGMRVTARSPYSPETTIGTATSDATGLFTLLSGQRAEEIVNAQRMHAGEGMAGHSTINTNAMHDSVSHAMVCLSFDHPQYRADELSVNATSLSLEVGTVQAQPLRQPLTGVVINHRDEPTVARLAFQRVPAPDAIAPAATVGCDQSVPIRETLTDVQGRFAIHLDAQGQYEVTVFTQLYQPRVIMLDVTQRSDAIRIKLN